VPELGLFPLPIVLVPTERIPLHIFEPRYRELIDECIELGQEFGLVLATGDGAVHEIGTRARVAQVVELLDDGAMNVIVEGGERFRLLDLTSGRAFTTEKNQGVSTTARRPPGSRTPRSTARYTERCSAAWSRSASACTPVTMISPTERATASAPARRSVLAPSCGRRVRRASPYVARIASGTTHSE